MRSDQVKGGFAKAPHRSLFKAMGYTDEELSRPLIGVVNAQSEIVPGHIHLDTIAKAAHPQLRQGRARHADGRGAAEPARHRVLRRAHARRAEGTGSEFRL